MRHGNRTKAVLPAKSPRQNAQHDLRVCLSMRELAELWGVSQRSVWTLVNTGKLDAFRVGRSVRIPWDSIHAYMEGGGT
jgi:excisionase family DNA binding protein